MLESRSNLKEQLSAAKAEISQLESDLTQANAQIEGFAEIEKQLAEANLDLTESIELLTAEQEDHTATKELLATEQAKTTPEAISKLVTAELANAGHPPIEDGPSGSDGEEKTLTRSAFNQLTPRQRSEFSINGGTITD